MFGNSQETFIHGWEGLLGQLINVFIRGFGGSSLSPPPFPAWRDVLWGRLVSPAGQGEVGGAVEPNWNADLVAQLHAGAAALLWNQLKLTQTLM